MTKDNLVNTNEGDIR